MKASHTRMLCSAGMPATSADQQTIDGQSPPGTSARPSSPPQVSLDLSGDYELFRFIFLPLLLDLRPLPLKACPLLAGSQLKDFSCSSCLQDISMGDTAFAIADFFGHASGCKILLIARCYDAGLLVARQHSQIISADACPKKFAIQRTARST